MVWGVLRVQIFQVSYSVFHYLRAFAWRKFSQELRPVEKNEIALAVVHLMLGKKLQTRTEGGNNEQGYS